MHHSFQSAVHCLVVLTLAFISQISVCILSPCNVIVSKGSLTLQNNLGHIPSFIFLKRFYINCLFFEYLEESTNGSSKLVEYSLGMGVHLYLPAQDVCTNSVVPPFPACRSMMYFFTDLTREFLVSAIFISPTFVFLIFLLN